MIPEWLFDHLADEVKREELPAHAQGWDELLEGAVEIPPANAGEVARGLSFARAWAATQRREHARVADRDSIRIPDDPYPFEHPTRDTAGIEGDKGGRNSGNGRGTFSSDDRQIRVGKFPPVDGAVNAGTASSA